MRLNVASLKNSSIPRALGVCSTDPRLLQWANEAQDRLLSYGRWWGSIQRVQFCVTGGCLVLPPEIATLEQLAVCGSPVPIVNGWFEFTETLARVVGCDGGCSCDSNVGANCNRAVSGNRWPCGHLQMRDHGMAVSASVTHGNGKKLRLYPANVADVGRKVVVQGRDSDGVWVRTSYDGVVQDGEQVSLALPYVETSTQWWPGSPTGVIKEATSYRVLLYEVDSAGNLRALGYYQPWETLPAYRTFQVPFLGDVKCGGCGCQSDGSARRTLTALAKLAHVPLALDNDWLVLQNLSAYKEAMLAVRDWEQGDLAAGNRHFYGTAEPGGARGGNIRTLRHMGALPLLRAELQHMTGSRSEVYVHCENTNSLPYRLAAVN